MYNWGSFNHPSPMGNHRNFSTYTKTANDNMYTKVQNQNPWNHLAQRLLDIPHNKKFNNPNFVNMPTPAPGILYEKCSTFINGSNGYPNNLPKTCLESNYTFKNDHVEPRMPSPVKSAPVDIVVKDIKQVKSSGKSPRRKYHKKPKSRKNWHKQSLSMEMLIEDVDEVGTDVCNDPNYVSTSSSSSHFSPNCDTNVTLGVIEHSSWKPTLEQFIRSPKPKPINKISEKIILALPNSPICIKISTPVYFSISPPKPFGHRRIPSDCASEDSFVVFDDSESSSSEEDDDDDDVFDSEWSDDESDFIDFKDNSCKNTPKTEVEDIPFKKNSKKVHFADGKKLTEVHHMVAWSYAYQASRKGHWEVYARDRERFKRKIAETCSAEIGRILNPAHRQRVYEERFKETTSS